MCMGPRYLCHTTEYNKLLCDNNDYITNDINPKAQAYSTPHLSQWNGV